MTRVYLDGVLTDPAVIDPRLYRYVGMWRGPFPTHHTMQWHDLLRDEIHRGLDAGSSWGKCAHCGQVLCDDKDWSTLRTHWLRGCFDVPSYETKPTMGASQ